MLVLGESFRRVGVFEENTPFSELEFWQLRAPEAVRIPPTVALEPLLRCCGLRMKMSHSRPIQLHETRGSRGAKCRGGLGSCTPRRSRSVSSQPLATQTRVDTSHETAGLPRTRTEVAIVAQQRGGDAAVCSSCARSSLTIP